MAGGSRGMRSAGPIALAILEGITRGWTGAAATHAEGATHFSMLIWYISKNAFTARVFTPSP